jgi:hypothetical protein
LLQSALPKSVPATAIVAAQGLLTRGVVVAVYPYDDPEAIVIPNIATTEIYCAVLTYGSVTGQRTGVLPRCLVLQPRASLHEGDIWIPRATTMDITGAALDPNRSTNPFNMDGDHVLVGFIDDDMTHPVVLGAIPHPAADKGNEAGGLALSSDPARTRIKSTDQTKINGAPSKSSGGPRLTKHRGVIYGVDELGNYSIDLRNAHNGVHQSEGLEQAAPKDGTSGSYTIRIQEGAFLQLFGPNNELFEFKNDGTVNFVGAIGEQQWQFDPDGALRITADKQSSKILLNADGSIEIDAGNDAAAITIKGSKTELRTTEVELADGANQSVVLGNIWDLNRNTLNTAWSTFLTEYADALTALGSAAVAPGADPAVYIPVFTGAMALVIGKLALAISTFEQGDYLSDVVSTK